MQSFGSASSWQSRDSPSSSHNFLHSEGDQTEDEADVFLSEGEGDSGVGGGPGSPRTASPGARSTPAVFGGLTGSRLKRDQAGWCPGSTRVILVSPSGGVRTGGEGRTEGDFVFAQKCAELQGFVRPLLELLNGLKRGKYDRGLSSFQQSVAMDRIQRIVGVLQKPSMGERHLHTLLQVEMMLKLWFPQISPSAPPTSAATPAPAGSLARGAAPRWRRDQLHIPVKKRRLSWMNTDSPAQAAPACKRVQREEPALGVTSSPSERASARPGGRGARCEKEEGKEARGELSSRPESRLAPVPHPSKESGEGRGGNAVPPVATAGSPATQDTFISSTTRLSPPLDPAPVTHEPVRCHSQPIATETEGGRASETSRRWNRSLPLQTKPFTAPEQ
ncbi:circadian associated repressor of transcription a [Anguilla rostrata]|uniref:circadian associated repressor of transcription a n=1 Tax=Anguilla rostrata TaxID=7938 RepID=UPI0030CA7B8D